MSVSTRRLPPIQAFPSLLLPIEGEAPGPATTESAARRAAVLVLLFPRPTGPSLLLTERPATLSRHPGQISLPGGAVERCDASLWHTALRETREELGMRTGRIRALGRLQSVTVTGSRYLISPYVGWNPVPPALRPDPREVAEVIEVPLRDILDPATVVEEQWQLRGRDYWVTLYRFGGKPVWGATARILGDLAARICATRESTLDPGSVRPT